MMGTFAAVLAKSRIPTPEARYWADVTGDIEAVDGVLKITRIAVHYMLKLKPDQQPEAEKAFEVYMPSCPAAMSVKDAIDIRHDIVYEKL